MGVTVIRVNGVSKTFSLNRQKSLKERLVNFGRERRHREAFCAGIREFSARGAPAGSVGKWPVQFLIRRCAWHMLDHAWEMEDRDLSGGS